MKERYRAYHALCQEDQPAHLAVYKAVTLLCSPVIFTGRPESVREQTEAWIEQHLGKPKPLLFMRQDHEHEPSPFVKQKMLIELLAMVVAENQGAEGDLLAFDDREDVVAMYKAIGLRAMQLKIHDVCAMTPPKQERPPV